MLEGTQKWFGRLTALKELNKLLTLYLIKVLLVCCFSHLFADAVVLSAGQLGQLSGRPRIRRHTRRIECAV